MLKLARPANQEFQRLWIPASAGMTAKNVTNNLPNFWVRTLKPIGLLSE